MGWGRLGGIRGQGWIHCCDGLYASAEAAGGFSDDWGLAENFVPGGSRRDVGKWERLGVGVEEIRAG